MTCLSGNTPVEKYKRKGEIPSRWKEQGEARFRGPSHTSETSGAEPINDSFLKNSSCLGGAVLSNGENPVPGPRAPKPALLASAFSVHAIIPFLCFHVGPFSPIKPFFPHWNLICSQTNNWRSAAPPARVAYHIRGTLVLGTTIWQVPTRRRDQP